MIAKEDTQETGSRKSFAAWWPLFRGAGGSNRFSAGLDGWRKPKPFDSIRNRSTSARIMRSMSLVNDASQQVCARNRCSGGRPKSLLELLIWNVRARRNACRRTSEVCGWRTRRTLDVGRCGLAQSWAPHHEVQECGDSWCRAPLRGWLGAAGWGAARRRHAS